LDISLAFKFSSPLTGEEGARALSEAKGVGRRGCAARLRGKRLNCGEYSLANIASARQNVAVPEAHNLKTLAFQISVPSLVSPIIGMLAAICLDNQPMLETDEIDNIEIVDDLLPFPPQTSQPLVA
jgi:hypothetical protein